ncbi:MAG: hypothetical protein RL701_1118 [Pseudomonadota bacterium]|jgi:hypothetical protein
MAAKQARAEGAHGMRREPYEAIASGPVLNPGLAEMERRSWRSGSTLAVLRELENPAVNLVAWQRRLPVGTKRGLATWARSCATPFDEVLRVSDCDLSPAVAGMEATLGDRMNRDLGKVLRAFADVTHSSRVRISFGPVLTDRCRKFHVDYVRYRLVATYLGPGTEWLPDEAVDRAAMAQSFESPSEANRAIVRSEAAIRRAATGEVLVLKGAVPNERHGAVHRSPPLTGADQLRVVLVLSS